jgi:fructoselysine 6-kinase
MKVIGIGDNVVDNYMHIRTKFPGGNALNFSVYASMLGCDAAYLGVFGSDDNARHVQQTLSRLHIDTSRCRHADGPSGEALLTLENGERRFISSNEGGISQSVPMEFIFEDPAYLQSFSIAHTSAYSYMDGYLARMQDLNPLLSYDFSDDFDVENALSLCPYIDVGFFSCTGWTEEAALGLLEKAQHRGCTLAVATRGPHDALLFDGRSWYRQASLAAKPIDTLGAGDAFITGFLISYVGGKSDTPDQPASLIEKSLEKAASFAAKICQLQGAFGHGSSY